MSHSIFARLKSALRYLLAPYLLMRLAFAERTAQAYRARERVWVEYADLLADELRRAARAGLETDIATIKEGIRLRGILGFEEHPMMEELEARR